MPGRVGARLTGIAEDEVKSFNRTGSVRVSIEVTEDVMRGVVSIPYGWGHSSRTDTELDIASALSSISVNDLTDDQSVDKPTGTLAFNGVKVSIAGASTYACT